MFLLSPQTKVFLAKDPTDMRKSFCGLIVLAEAVLHQDPASGHLFVFVNKRRDMLKILHWDGSGWLATYFKNMASLFHWWASPFRGQEPTACHPDGSIFRKRLMLATS